MPSSLWKRRVVPVALGLAMLGVIVAAALSPTIGAVAADSNCQYTNCQSGTSSAIPWWVWAVIAVIVLVAILGAVLLMRRRRPPAGTSAGPAQAWQPPAAGPSPPPGGTGTGPSPPSSGASPAYLETPEDVGSVPPTVGVAAGGAAAGAAAAGAAAEEEPDIDSLMAELDKISGEILKKAPKNGKADSGSGGGNGST